MRTWMIGLLAASFGGPFLAAQDPSKRGEDPRTLYFFFSPAALGSVEGAQRAAQFIKAQKGQVRLRPVMLLDDFSVIRKVEEASPLYKALKELQTLGPLDIPLYDEEGLELAVRWEVRSVPAFVLVAQGRAHRVLGPVVKLEELLECRP
jgi:hypothetical protein